MVQFPQCLFKPGDKPMAGLLLDSIMVRNADELADALKAGWLESPEAADAARNAPDPEPPLDVPMSREAMEAEAKALGIKIDGRWSDKRLSDAIKAAK